MDILKEKWEEILYLVKVEHELSDISFKTWLKPLQIHSVTDHTVTILVPSEQMGIDYITKKYMFPIKVAIAEMTGKEYEIEFILPEQAKKYENKKKFSSVNLVDNSSNAEKANLNPKYTFDTFVVGNNNKFAHAAALAVAESPGKMYNPLFIHGGAGLGKTHLMHSIAHFILNQNPEKRVLYVTSETFTNELIDSIRNGNNTSMTKFREKYRNVDVLLIDDIQFIIGKEATQEEFFHTFNELYQHNKQVIVASDRLPTEIATVDPRLSSRLTMGMPIDIQLPDFETRCAIIKLKTELKGDEIDDETVQYLAKNIQTNVRDLEGHLNRILALASIRGISPREVIGGEADSVAPQILASANRGRVAQPKKVIETVSNYYGIETKELLGKSRQKDIKTARQIAMYLMNEELNLSTVRIGNEFQKDHTTIMHGIKVIKEDLKNDFNLRSQISELREKIYE